MTESHSPRSGGEARNRPKRRSDAEPLITSESRRRQLGGSFADQQSVEEAWEYDALRPRYPEAAVQQILALGEGAARGCVEQGSTAAQSSAPRIVDLGAGTGILSRQLLCRGAQVHAVEPSQAMTEVLAQSVQHQDQQEDTALQSRLRITRAPAEETGLERGSADVVVAAQAWHWFDAGAVQQEVRRLLIDGGQLALIWNYLDTSDETVHRLTRIMRAGDVYRPQWRPTLDAELFGPVQTTEHRWSRSLSVAEIFRYATTLSSWLSASEEDRIRRRGNLEDYLLRERGLAEEDVLELPMITALHAAQLRPAG